jgi:hypothetical protein
MAQREVEGFSSQGRAAVLVLINHQVFEAHPIREGALHPFWLAASPRPGFGRVAGVSVDEAPFFGEFPVRLCEFAPPLDLLPDLRFQVD